MPNTQSGKQLDNAGEKSQNSEIFLCFHLLSIN